MKFVWIVKNIRAFYGIGIFDFGKKQFNIYDGGWKDFLGFNKFNSD